MSAQPDDVVAFDGRMTRWTELRLCDFWSGFSFGAGFFETLLVRAGVPLFLSEHLARLRSSLARYPHAVLPPPAQLLTSEAVAQSVAECLAHSEGRGASFTGALKLIASDGHLLLTFRSYDADAARRLHIAQSDPQTYRSGDESLNHKSISYLRQHQHAHGPVVFINERHQLCETATGNLFFLRGGRLETPTLQAPCLPGVIRSVLLAAGAGVESDVNVDDLHDVTACVMTNSLQLVTPVDEILGVRMHQSDELADQLRAVILERVHG